MSAYPPASLPEDPTDVQAILNEEIEHESCSRSSRKGV